jgi:chromosomal replication initiation ATPase DnaA
VTQDAIGSFVESAGTREALAALRSLAETGTLPANPLLLLAAHGLGKSHLLKAGAELYRAAHPGARVESDTVGGLAERSLGERGGILPVHECDLLLLDDLHQLADRPDLVPLVEEVLEVRIAWNRPVVIASALAPGALPHQGLTAVLERGQLLALQAPGAGERLAILRRRAGDLSPALPDEVLAAVAGVPLKNVRELLAALQRLAAFQAVSPAPLDPGQARILIGGYDAEDAESPATAAGAPAGAAEPPVLATADDEFGSFLSEVVASVTRQVDEWRAQLAEAVLRHGANGYRTSRLEAILEGELSADPGALLAAYEHEVARLGALEAETRELAPDLAESPVFRDPDRLGEAHDILARARGRQTPLPGPNPAFRLEHFAEGTGNRQALRLVRAVVREPGRHANPLLLIGASGLGKTHLLHALGNALADRGTEAVACLGVLTIAGDLEAADTPAARTRWRQRFLQAGALLLDDLDLLAGHDATQEQVTHLVAALLDSGRQVAATSSRLLAEVEGLDPRLVTRFEAGVVEEIGRPDRETRLQVVKQALRGTPGDGDAALADWLAARPAETVRAVQGMVRQVLGAASVRGLLPSPALAREALERREHLPGAAAAPRVSGPGSAIGRQMRNPEKMVLVWPRIEDCLFEAFD